MKPWLLDAGPIIAYIDPRDPFPQAAVAAMDRFKGEFITTNAVIAEVMHFAKRRSHGPAVILELLEAAGVHVEDYCQMSAIRRAVSIMEKYWDSGMDFADATLVLLGEDRRLYSLCTLDVRGFSVFRTASGRRFELVLEPFAI